jgi:hypothetical protein
VPATRHNVRVNVRRPSPASLAAGLWLGVVAALAVVRAATGWDAPDALAGSPETLAHGAVWLLGTSGLIVQGWVPAAQIAGTAVLVWVVVRRLGGRVFWLAALAAHVGATLVTYTGIAVAWLADPRDVRPLVATPDYGISAVAAGCLGVVAVAGALGALPRGRLAAALGSAALLGFLVLIPADGELYDVEHLLALLAGATVAAAALHDASGAHRLALRPPRMPSLRRRAHAAPDACR